MARGTVAIPLVGVVGALCVVVGSLLAPPRALGTEATEAESSPFGLNIHAPVGNSLGFLLDRTADVGVGWVRIDLVWAAVEPEPGVLRWKDYDALIAAARARNLEILAIIAYTPAWATDGPEISGVPRHVEDWSDFCSRAATRYRDQIKHWEVWNEPNLPRFWSGSRAEYVQTILEPAAAAIRAANPEAKIGGPSLAHDTIEGRDWHGWLTDVLRESGDTLDFVTHHVYDLDDPAGVVARISGTTEHGDDPSRWNDAEPSLEEVLRRAGFDRPIWLSETGWRTTRLDEIRQADLYRRFLDLWLTSPDRPARLARVFFYELIDSHEPRFPKYGLLRASGRPKPSYAALRDFIATWTPAPGDSDPPNEPTEPTEPADPTEPPVRPRDDPARSRRHPTLLRHLPD
jgi:hypothetical protein